jgi:hypothetical protein
LYVSPELLNTIAHKITDKQKDNLYGKILGGVQLSESEAVNKMIFILTYKSLQSNKVASAN